MALKFSQFVAKTAKTDVAYVVGYNGTENIQITPADLLAGLAGGTITGGGTINKIAKFSGAISLVDSIITDDGTSATFAGDVTAESKKFIATSSSSGDYVRMYGASGTGEWDIYGSGNDLRISENTVGGTGILTVDRGATFGGTITVNGSGNNAFGGDIYLTGSTPLISTATGIEYQIRNANGASGDHVFKSFNTAILTLDGGTNNSTFAGNILIGNTVTNPASGFADQTGIGLKYSTTVPEIQVSSDSTAMQLGRTSTGGEGQIMAMRKAGTTVHSFDTNNVSIGTSATFTGTVNALNLTITNSSQFNSIVTIEKIQQSNQFDTSSFLRLHPSAVTNTSGFTNMFFGTDTANNYGVAIGGLRAGTDGTPSFVIRMLNDSVIGTEVFRINNNGLITIDSSIILDNNEGLFWESTSGTNEYFVSNGADLQFGTGGTERIKILSDGRFQFSGISATQDAVIQTNETNTGTGTLRLQAGAYSAAYGGGIVMYANSHASKPGNVAIGLSAVAGSEFRVNLAGQDTSTDVLTLTRAGNMTITGTLTQNSDITLKENIKPLESQLDIISKLNPVSYNKKENKESLEPFTGKKEIGFIAQEVEEILPEFVSENKEGIKSLAYGNMNAVLVKAIQELKAEVDKLKKK